MNKIIKILNNIIKNLEEKNKDLQATIGRIDKKKQKEDRSALITDLAKEAKELNKDDDKKGGGKPKEDKEEKKPA